MKPINFDTHINSSKKYLCLAAQKIKAKEYHKDNHTANYLSIRLSSIIKQINELKQLAGETEREEKKIKKQACLE